MELGPLVEEEPVTHLEHMLWLAQQAYLSYRDRPGSRWHEEAPPWSELSTDEREAWHVVAETLWHYLIGD